LTWFYSLCGQSYSGVCLFSRLQKAKLTQTLDGASLIYTTPSTPSQLPILIHSSLGIHSLLKKHPLKHNVIDRDKIVVPPNWDSWGKIRVLREGFDVELASNGWTVDLKQSLESVQDIDDEEEDEELANGDGTHSREPEGSTVGLYEAAVQDPTMDALHRAGRNTHSTKLEVETTETQAFLGQQLKVLESYRQKHEAMVREEARSRNGNKNGHDEYYNGLNPEPKVLEHIGPVQFNMGGIQVDADDMVQRLKVRLSLTHLSNSTLTSPRNVKHTTPTPLPPAKAGKTHRKWIRRIYRPSFTDS